MSILPSSSRWPLYLAIAGLIVVGASVWYTNVLANKLAEIEKKNVSLYSQVLQRLQFFDPNEDDGDVMDDVSIEQEILANMETVPRLLVNSFTNEIDDAQGFGESNLDTLYLKSVLERWVESGVEPIQIDAQLLYVGESWLLQQLRYFPYVQLFLITSFVIIGVLGINQTRKAEQNRVWVGLAKETAHQLGTPISAIMGWVEHLKMMYADDDDIMEVSNELAYDVDRLSMVANRFSKIGATPELEPANIYAELNKCRDYMQKRAPRKVAFDFPNADAGNAQVSINPLLFDWVFENLLRNALDAMDGKGKLTGRIREEDTKIHIDITDTGKGIAPKNVRKVFNPGFTTKKRGWGLGLSLVKRIVQEYHNGKIAVSHSEVGKGTTFTITLPRV
ncbi:HAMP domain-containing histidine kinase [Neolewinella aurantiaca]|uniref:histidine kinase n=1 Tax=Neolewinella aurantiaca TaxID=2602767 RepID=A0A5C7FSL5_9BACT|nr:HAMP domain-containing histidine kinase [Neolewinella aurantiaca]